MKEWFRKTRYVMYFMEDGRRCAVVEQFMEELKTENERGKRQVANVEALIRRFAENGRLNNPQKFKNLGGGTVEFKAHQIRIFGYLNGTQDGRGRLMLTHGQKKKKSAAIPKIVSTILNKLTADPDWEKKK